MNGELMGLNIMPKEPLRQWLIQLGNDLLKTNLDDSQRQAAENMTRIELDQLQVNTTVYLIPFLHSNEEGGVFMKKNCTQFFENELRMWTLHSELWPLHIGFDQFLIYFDFEFLPNVIDYREAA
jgi:hypothetical protein